jgi:hypothetical protein
MSATSETRPTPAVRLARAQAEIRALVGRGRLTPAERLELAGWQREWVAARRVRRETGVDSAA